MTVKTIEHSKINHRQGQRFAARALFILCLLASSLGGTIATPGSQLPPVATRDSQPPGPFYASSEGSSSPCHSLTALESTLQQLPEDSKKLMQYAAYLADDATIPPWLVSALLGTENQEQLREVVCNLASLSLMQVVPTQEDHIDLQVSQDVQVACRKYTAQSSEAALVTQILLTLAQKLQAQLPGVELVSDDNWYRVKLYEPHVAKVVTHLQDPKVPPLAVVASLLAWMGKYNNVVEHNYKQAVSFLAHALVIYKQVHQNERNHPDIARTLGNLGNAYRDLEKADQAKSFFERALAMWITLHSNDFNQPEIAETLYNLGDAYRALGRVDEAASFFKSAARTSYNLGNAWLALGDARQAVSFYQCALAIYEQVHNNDFNQPEIAETLYNLGDAYKALGRVDEAASFFTRAARTFSNLGHACRKSNAGQAVSYYERALAIYKQVYKEDPHHPDIARTLGNLGNACRKSNAGQAVSYYGLALVIYRQVHKKDPNHPNIAKLLNNLGIAWGNLKNLGKAVQSLKEALAMYNEVYKNERNHPDIAATLYNLGVAHYVLSKNENAVEYFTKALAIYEQRGYGPDDPDFTKIQRFLNHVQQSMSNSQPTGRVTLSSLSQQLFRNDGNTPNSAHPRPQLHSVQGLESYRTL